jgi:hypothetical protein
MSTELFQLRKRGIKLLLSAGLEDMKLNLQRTRYGASFNSSSWLGLVGFVR